MERLQKAEDDFMVNQLSAISVTDENEDDLTPPNSFTINKLNNLSDTNELSSDDGNEDHTSKGK